MQIGEILVGAVLVREPAERAIDQRERLTESPLVVELLSFLVDRREIERLRFLRGLSTERSGRENEERD